MEEKHNESDNQENVIRAVSQSVSLGDFQDQITASILNGNVSTDSFVIVRLDDEKWLVDLFALREASIPSKIAKNAGAPNWVLGIANFKGQVWTVIDMRMLIKGKPTTNSKWGWVTLLRHQENQENISATQEEGQKIGLLWTEIVEITPKIKYDVQFKLPEQWCKKHYVDKDGILWRELDIEQIVGSKGVVGAWSSRKNSELGHQKK